MDSNFQVTINANLQGLRKAIGEAQSTLAQFDKSVDGAAKSTKALEREANRGRLAAFAFGQVIRDAGFFSQSFGLGLLAISNNIPILIDQLTLLAGLTGAAGTALSILGSILTAGLTIWAYSSNAVDKNKQSIDEWRESLEDTTEVQLRGRQAALDEVTSLDMLYRAATDVSNSMYLRLKAAKGLQDQYPTTFANLSAEQIALGKNEAAYNGLRDSIYGVAIAEAGKDKIVANASRILDNNTRILEARNLSIQKQNELLIEQGKTAGVDPNAVRVSTGATPGSVAINAEAEKSFARQAVLKKELFDLDQVIYNSTSDTNILNERNANIWAEIAKYTKAVVDNLDGGKPLKEITKTFGDINNAKPFEKINKEADKFFTRKVETKNLLGLRDFTNAMWGINDEITNILQNGIVATISSSFMAVGEAIATGGNIANAAGAAFLGSLATVAQQLGELAIGVGLGVKAIKASLESLNPVVAIAAGVALLTLAGYARGRAGAISKSGSNNSGSNSSNAMSGNYGGVRPFAAGGIVSGPTNALIGEYPGARNNPEVVAPLDKLTKIIGGSIGGDMGGQLSARISGNDLVILLDRASKNRKNYF